MKHRVQRIVSGGQTGVDRGALDAARDVGIPHGGWCPLGRRAEDGTIPLVYDLHEMPTADYRERTEQNVIDSDATLILCRGRLHGGTQLTRRYALRYEKPLVVVDLEQVLNITATRLWLADHDVRVLNVAGPRESSAPGIGAQARQYMGALLRHAVSD